MKIACIILTRNEENNIIECLKSIKWCDETIVIDDNSTDKTVKLSEKFGAKVFIRSLNNNFSQQRNFALQKTTADWVLYIDADERVSNALQGEISQRIYLMSDNVGYYIKRKDFMWGKELRHGELENIKLLRLAKRDAGEWKGDVHEVWMAKGKIGELNNYIKHYPHQTIKEFLKDINFYTDIRASELFKEGIHIYWVSIIFFPIGKFLVNFIIKRGFLDGIPGLIIALIMSFHSFLVRSKLWFLNQKL